MSDEAPSEITRLNDRTIRQIAAGEVVERPASVVKELVENALDAGASRVAVAVEGDGTDLVRVRDDGRGMTADELAVAVEEHTTSKIDDVADLAAGVGTLGFRGEALHTIGAVSRLTIRSRPPDADRGHEIVVEGGEAGEVRPVGCPPGTVVEVEDLFFNTPARRKFLRTPTTEFDRVNTVVTQYALANPDVAVSLERDGRETFATPGQGGRRAAVLAVYGREVAEAMVEVDGGADGIGVEGLISHPETTRSSRDYLATFVDGRYVPASALREAVISAYGGQIANDRYPFAVLFVDVPLDTIDVNVHPRKTEIRFDDEAAVRAAVERAVREALLDHGLVRSTAPRGRGAPDETAVAPEAPDEEAVLDEAAARERTQTRRDRTPTRVERGESASTDADAVDTGGESTAVADEATAADEPIAEADEPTTDADEPTTDADGTTVEADRTAAGADGSVVDADEAAAARDADERADDAPSTGRPTPRRFQNPEPAGPEADAAPDADAADATDTTLDAWDADAGDAGGDDAAGDRSGTGRALAPTSQRTLDGGEAGVRSFDALPRMRVLGQLHDTYVVAETADGMVLVDQHAADERVNYERLRAALDGDPRTQALADPVELELTAREAALFDEGADALAALGFRADRTGERTVAVRGVPAVFDATLDPSLLRDALADLTADGPDDRTVEAVADDLLADLACYPSVTGNTSLTEGSVLDLLDALDDCENPYACPHGRPTVVAVDADELAARFERDYPGHGGRRAED